jgi:branched-subunit amino acid aminotransferase/4-amino-4-deoxychorismate lyase
MAGTIVSLDGHIVPLAEARVPVTDPAFTVGWAIFETMSATGGQIPRLGAHLDRLAQSADAALIPMPSRALLEAELTALAQAHGGGCRLRLTLTGGGARVIVAEDLEEGRLFRPVRAVRGPHVDDPFLGGAVKHTSRAPWIVAVKRSGADEVLRVDAQGRFTEATTAAIVAVVDGVIWTAPHDGRILASTTLNELLDRAASLNLRVHREGALAAGPWDGLYVASTTRVLAPVVELDGVALPGWDPVGKLLAGVEQGALGV